MLVVERSMNGKIVDKDDNFERCCQKTTGFRGVLSSLLLALRSIRLILWKSFLEWVLSRRRSTKETACCWVWFSLDFIFGTFWSDHSRIMREHGVGVAFHPNVCRPKGMNSIPSFKLLTLRPGDVWRSWLSGSRSRHVNRTLTHPRR